MMLVIITVGSLVDMMIVGEVLGVGRLGSGGGAVGLCVAGYISVADG